MVSGVVGARVLGDVAVVWPSIDMGAGDELDPDSTDRLEPDADGNYDLGVLGWVFIET